MKKGAKKSKPKKQYLVLVPFSSARDGRYQYVATGGFFPSKAAARHYMKLKWSGELIAEVSEELNPKQRELIKSHGEAE